MALRPVVRGTAPRMWLRYVDPSRPPGLFSRAYAALANTRLGRFISVHVAWRLDPYLMRMTRGRLGMGLAIVP